MARTTEPGFVNNNGQRVVRKTRTLGNDHLQKVYELECDLCKHRYGSNGSNNHERRCPMCQGGSSGLDYEPSMPGQEGGASRLDTVGDCLVSRTEPMEVYGIDFTSTPSPRKPITCLRCTLDDKLLRAGDLEELTDFAAFEAVLRRSGRWIAGIDFPFGQSRKFIETIGWPSRWEDYVLYAESLGRDGFCKVLAKYSESRPNRDKEHRRQTDIAMGSISPQKLYGVPVGKMFFEGASRLIHTNVTIPQMRAGDPDRIVVEAYPGVLARAIIGRRSYKNDKKTKQTCEHRTARQSILAGLNSHRLFEQVGFRVEADRRLADDATGDHLDALLCAVQASWAWRKRTHGYGAPESTDSLEGWIAAFGLD